MRGPPVIDHSLLKLVHLSCVVLSITGFTLRALLMLTGSSLLRRRWVRTVPHFVDTLLFFSGLGLAYNLHQYPGTSPWLTAKLVALVLYVLFGAVALRGRNLPRRLTALVLAYVTFAYMASVALTKNPLPW